MPVIDNRQKKPNEPLSLRLTVRVPVNMKMEKEIPEHYTGSSCGARGA